MFRAEHARVRDSRSLDDALDDDALALSADVVAQLWSEACVVGGERLAVDDDEPDCADITAAALLPSAAAAAAALADVDDATRNGATPAEAAVIAKRSLRALYGTRPNWWGDLGARETRWLYHQVRLAC